MEQNIEVYAKKGYALKGYALGGICLKGICLRGNMPNRFYALKGICLNTVKFYAKKGLCLKKLCPKGIMPYDSMPNYRQTAKVLGGWVEQYAYLCLRSGWVGSRKCLHIEF